MKQEQGFYFYFDKFCFRYTCRCSYIVCNKQMWQWYLYLRILCYTVYRQNLFISQIRSSSDRLTTIMVPSQLWYRYDSKIGILDMHI